LSAGPFFSSNRPFKVRGFKATVWPRAKNVDLLSSLYDDYSEGVINDDEMTRALMIAGHPSLTSDPQRQSQLMKASRTLRGPRGPRKWRRVRRLDDILKLCESTGLLATLIAASLPPAFEVLIEPQISIRDATHSFDYALGRRVDGEFQLTILSEVKRSASTTNLTGYVQSFFTIANELLNLFPLNVDEEVREAMTPVFNPPSALDPSLNGASRCCYDGRGVKGCQAAEREGRRDRDLRGWFQGL